MQKKALLYFLMLCVMTVSSQEVYFPKNDGVSNINSNYTAITNVKIYVTPSLIIKNGTLLIKEGKIVNSKKTLKLPINTLIIDGTGKTIYPSFIDSYTSFGITKPKQSGRGRSAQYGPDREGFYWNDHIRSDQTVMDFYKFDDKAAKEFRKAGFGVVNTHQPDGIMRGTGALIALTPSGGDEERILNDNSSEFLSTSKSLLSSQAYPSSIMGTLALLRQFYLDADWYKKGNISNTDLAIQSHLKNKGKIQIMNSGSRVNTLRTDKVGDEFGIQYVFLGSGNEYERIESIKNTNGSFILPINFPKAYDVNDTFLTDKLDLEDMREWNQRPTNPAIMANNNIRFAITTHGLKSPNELKNNILNAVKHGLDKTTALEALTSIPATLLNQSTKLGNLKKGAYANFLIVSGDIFEEKTIIHENWVKGHRDVISSMEVNDIRGEYIVNISDQSYKINLSGSPVKLKSEVTLNDKILKSSVSFKDNWLQSSFSNGDSISGGHIKLRALANSEKFISGKLFLSDGTQQLFTAKHIKTVDKKNDSKTKKDSNPGLILPITFPNGAYGVTSLPKQKTTLFKNATVWTNEKEGILKNTDVLIKDGKIHSIGKNLISKESIVIDASGKHLTTGIIDEHSHIAASSINEGGHNSSAEVSIAEVVNEEDVNIYRSLAGGVTTIQILHGSANPIGGQSAIIKLKWGETADNLLYKNAPKFIKFALGENVKQSNWGSTSRFPQTRMGVEQLYMDYFNRAKEYEIKKNSGKDFRKDIEMEVLLEILNKQRFISCHSYVQSEINMLMKVAEHFDFNVNTFTHILEGYKVADKMKEHGAGASTFSDWWAYKFEVNDAIPYNAAIMHDVGVVTAINSDSAEMIRRLNQEAAKSVKYGGVSEEDAWKFITLNPAKLLHIDDRLGSMKIGKDADLVLWNEHPMSIYAIAEKTMIEGAIYFDKNKDTESRKEIYLERLQLINMMHETKNKGMATQPIKKRIKEVFHCDSE
jgi:imidazolonepropionase-like amidohydrolase